jgi:hypothetical protein
MDSLFCFGAFSFLFSVELNYFCNQSPILPEVFRIEVHYAKEI